MSNKTQLQTNNTKYASLIETLRGKAVPTGEDVTDETNAYTTKLSQLETAVTALEAELEGKTSGGGSSSSKSTINITINSMDTILFYWDSEGSSHAISSAGAINALAGIVFTPYVCEYKATGNYIIPSSQAYGSTIRFLSDGGTLTATTGQGGGGGI